MKLKTSIFTTLLLLAALAQAQTQTVPQILKWVNLPDIPPAEGQDVQLGLAGPYCGVSNGALIIAGGANFPNGAPWHGGAKVWWDDIYVLEKTPEGEYKWYTGFKLPKALAYGAAVTTEQGVVCIGGCDSDRCYSDVFLLRWDPEAKTIAVETMPSLPGPIAFTAAAFANDAIYVASGQSTMTDASAMNNFWSFTLGDEEWQVLPSWDGPPRVLPILAAQDFEGSRHVYLFSGRNVKSNGDTELLNDSYRYSPASGQWTRVADSPRCMMAGVGIDFGAQHILLIGGDDGRNWGKDLQDDHPGFAQDMFFAYHTLTDTWIQDGTLPLNHVTTNVVSWDGGLVIPSGEIRPAVRTSEILKGVPVESKQVCAPLDYLVVVIYLLALVGVGFYCARKERTTDDFFLAGRRIPWWAAGLSIFGTQLSAITFMAIPAKTYSSNWMAFMYNMGIVAITPLIVMFFLPFYRRLNVTTAYEYLEKRFNVVVRLLGSALFIAFQLGRIGIVLLLPSLALSVVTGVDVYLCILIMGVLATIYTVMGGIEAVIWTDVLQVIVLVGGALLCLGHAIAHVDGGFVGIVSTAAANHKFDWIDWHFDLGSLTIWVIILSWLNSLIPYASDQTVIQRYLTTRNEGAARRAIWTNAILTVPASLLFFFMGTALFVFYKNFPSHLDPGMAKVDNILPWFIMRELPAGVSGLIIAALFAASMSSLDSSMNSMATAVVTDFYRRFTKETNEEKCLRIARTLTALFGAMGVGLAMVMAATNFKSLWDQFVMIVGLLGGGLGGLFVLGVFTKRANAFGAIVGLLIGGVMQYIAKQYSGLHGYLYAGVGLLTCVLVGYLVSCLKPDEKDVTGLTIYTMLPEKSGEPRTQ